MKQNNKLTNQENFIVHTYASHKSQSPREALDCGPVTVSNGQLFSCWEFFISAYPTTSDNEFLERYGLTFGYEEFII